MLLLKFILGALFLFNLNKQMRTAVAGKAEQVSAGSSLVSPLGHLNLERSISQNLHLVLGEM